MNLLGLRYFIAIAENKSFTKAADSLFVTQPTLSRKILELEDYLGVSLFVRGRHSTDLTPAGQILFKEATDIINRCDNLKNVVNPQTNELSGILRIAYQSYLDTSILQAALDIMNLDYPRINFALTKGTPQKVWNHLSTDLCDVVFALNIFADKIPELRTIMLMKNRLQVAVPKSHPLANRDSVDLRSLSEEYFVLLEREVSPFTVDYVISLCMKHGFSPKVSQYANDIDKAYMLANSGKGITFIHSISRTSNSVSDLKLLDIESDDAELDFILAYKMTNENPAIPLLVKALKKHQEVGVPSEMRTACTRRYP